jgi:Family of unknown function (DUF6886)
MSNPEALFHFSEDPDIRSFVPHIPRTNPSQEPAVWAIDARHAPLYWFPRDCPRGTVWANDERDQAHLAATFLTSAVRLHAAESSWLERIRATKLFAYQFDPAPFEPWPAAEGQFVAHVLVQPITVRPLGDLLALHADAGIELRFAPDLTSFWVAVVTSGLPFSGVRLPEHVKAKAVAAAHDIARG